MNPVKKSKAYHFHTEWEHDYFFTEVKGKCICLLCHASVAVGKKGNVERHFNTTHSKVNTEFPANSTMRKEKVKQLKNQLTSQQSVFTKNSDKTTAVTLASYKISQVIAKNKKPFEDGEYIKESFVEAANCLFDGFKNKSEIMSAINSLQLSARTVTRRVETMSEDVISQLKTDLKRCTFLSLQFDESTDISDTSQLALFVRMVFDDFTVKEELLKIIPLKGRTRGEDVFSSVKDYLISENIPIQKLVGITTDGAPAFTGVQKGFIALCRKDDMFPSFLSYHCIIHQQALCGQFLNANNVMKAVVKLINHVRAHALQRRQFRTLIEEMNLEYGELLLHTEVRWLSKGKILRRFYELLPAIIAFLKERNEDYSILEEPTWLRDFGFLTDITEKLNELNLQLQGKDKNILQMISEIKSFIAKLELWEKNLRQGNLKHFPSLKEQVEKEINVQPYTGDEGHIDMLTKLKYDFESRFCDFRKIESLAQFISNPYMALEAENLSHTIEQDFNADGPTAELEIVTLQNDLCLKSVIGQENERFWSLVPKDKYPVLVNMALKMKALFSSTYLCESTFSNMKFIKNKYRNRLTDDHLDSCIRLGITNYEPDVKKLTNNMDCQTSH